ncbi:Bifunctional uridylyltransferase/uridylyl-removing enzyme [Pseudovibrio sp. Ad13]|uniref:glycine cleavage system protein R n=1 Tax=Pseudovibrio sp. Ad13 TaxID=989396 RepID=UPI0007AEE4D3|nr:ACT domain-containing protein [Pseudovibrio sp. Ad13]KZK87537.1 Bifunctional uridylyltransferase/uridylyl-removing enzyme [Pseudovibrio sp. Ad13]
MKKELVLTVVADDRPGLVGEISKVVADHKANWIDSSLSRLGGQFAGIVRVHVEKAQAADLSATLTKLESVGLTIGIHVHNTGDAPAGAHALLHILGQDQPGMISRVSSVLADLHVSIETLESLVEPGSMSGDLMFRANARIIIPPHLSPAEVSEALEGIAADLMIDVELNEAAVEED